LARLGNLPPRAAFGYFFILAYGIEYFYSSFSIIFERHSSSGCVRFVYYWSQCTPLLRTLFFPELADLVSPHFIPFSPHNKPV